MSDFRSEASFRLDTRTLRSIEELGIKLRATSSTDVIRNALSLLKVAVDNADPDSLVVVMLNKDGEPLKVDLKASN